MTNRIFEGEKAIRVGRCKVFLCAVDGCTKERQGRNAKYCFEHRLFNSHSASGKPVTKWYELHNNKFFDEFDKQFNINPIEVK